MTEGAAGAGWFDDSRLDDERVLAQIDPWLRRLAESGSRVRRESAAAEALTEQASHDVPRAVIAAGPDSRLLRAVLEPSCPVPFVAWPSPALPGWAGGLDLVVMLAPVGDDPAAASAVAEAVRRGCQVVVACPESSMVAAHAAGRWTTLIPTTTGDQLATAVVMLDHLHASGLGPQVRAGEVAGALDEVAIACSPHRDLAVNPAKMLAIALADHSPLLWGGSVLAARAARRIAESMRRATGRGTIAGDAEQLMPVLVGTPKRSVFDDPFAEPQDDTGASTPRPVLVIVHDGSEDPVLREDRARLVEAAERSDVRIEVIDSESGSDVARYASLQLTGSYVAAYLQAGRTGS